MGPLKKAYSRCFQKIIKYSMCIFDWSEPELLEGPGAVLELPALIKSKGVGKVLVVTDQNLMDLHLPDGLLQSLDEAEIGYVVYAGTQQNPTIDNVEEARALFLENECEAFVAFGGGSPMDCAKAAACRITNPGVSVRRMLGTMRLVRKPALLFGVPTTAGTGSETTVAAVITDPEARHKRVISDPRMHPRYAVLDPALTVSLPPHLTATTGMDALTHAVEAYIGKSNVRSTTHYAEEAVKIIFSTLESAYADGNDMEARTQMLKASFYAGMAFTRAYVGYVHAIGHNLGGMYGIPHGLAMSVILPYVLDFYGSAAHRRLAQLAEMTGVCAEGTDEEKANAFIAEIRAMNSRMNIPDGFTQIQEEDIPLLVKRALKEANPMYPVPKIMNAADCEAVIRQLMK